MKEIIAFVEKCKCLIVDPQSASRSTVRKLFTEFGVKSIDNDAANNFSDALELFQKNQHSIVICEYKLGEKNGIDFLIKVRELQPDRLRNTFILLSENNSLVIAARAAEEEVDAVIMRPFTFKDLMDRFTEVMKTKAKPSDYFDALNDARVKLEEKKFSEAMEAIEDAKKLDEKPALAWYYEGQAALGLGDQKRAEEAFSRGLTLNPVHYKSSQGLVQLWTNQKRYEEAFNLSLKVSKEYPPSPKRIPQLVHLSITNKKYEEVENFYKMFLELADPDPAVSQYLAAGLVTSSKFFLKQGEIDRATGFLDQAAKVAQGKPGILKEIATAYFNVGSSEKANAVLSNAPDEVRDSIEVRVAELQFIDKSGKADVALQMANSMLKEGIKILPVYEIAVRRSVEAERSEQAVQDLIAEATQNFPNFTPPLLKKSS